MSGVKAGSALLGNRLSTSFMGREKKHHKRSKALRKQARMFATELGKLKGSYVKIGQMLALFGEHLLPPEVTEELHELEHQTTPLCWSALESHVRDSLGAHFEELDIDADALAAASLGQVHRARIRATGEEICLKVQYPGVRQSIDSDFDDVARMLRLMNWIDTGREFNDWLAEMKTLLKNEVDYRNEASRSEYMRHRLRGDQRFKVPRVYERYSTDVVLALEYVTGYEVTNPKVQALSQSRRDALGIAMLDLFFQEVFDWGVIQTDPNFGNYRIQLKEEISEEGNAGADTLVLLDFGAVREFSDDFLNPFRQIISAAHKGNVAGIAEGAVAIGCIRANDPDSVKDAFGEFCMSMLEPLRSDLEGVPDYAITGEGLYRWRDSKLIKRVGKLAAKSATSIYFKMPPREFSLIVRKLTGVFSFISVAGSEFNGHDMIDSYVNRFDQGGGMLKPEMA
ncbi:MAG: ABC1 kinase family protein [bacterium]